MKNITIYIALAVLFTACNSILDTEPSDTVATELFYETEQDLQDALVGVYDRLNSNMLRVSLSENVDQAYFPAASGMEVNIYDAGNPHIALIWSNAYSGIERANLLLANIDKPDMDEESRLIIKGEAKFLRAFYHFFLVSRFGNIVLKENPTSGLSDRNIYQSQNSAKEVYEFVYKEMVEAEGMVRPISDFDHAGRVTQSAVQGILARVCLYMAGYPNNIPGKYEDALYWAEQVINSGSHELNPSYSQVFINMIQNLYDTQESIFEIEFYTTGTTDPYGESGGRGLNDGIGQSLEAYGFAAGSWRIQNILYDKFEDTDTRRDWAIAPFKYVSNSNPPIEDPWDDTEILERNIGKYRRIYELTSDKLRNSNGTNSPILRYSDVLLMAAEAENEVNGPTIKAHNYLNQVRQRANASLINGVTSTVTFRNLIQDERHLELCFEDLRRCDLIRWNILLPKMQEVITQVYTNPGVSSTTTIENATRAALNFSDRDVFFPIPSSEIGLNKKLLQNPGW